SNNETVDAGVGTGAKPSGAPWAPPTSIVPEVPRGGAQPATPTNAVPTGVADTKPVESPKFHTMVIHNGEGVKRFRFPLNEDGEMIREEIQKSPGFEKR